MIVSLPNYTKVLRKIIIIIIIIIFKSDQFALWNTGLTISSATAELRGGKGSSHQNKLDRVYITISALESFNGDDHWVIYAR